MRKSFEAAYWMDFPEWYRIEDNKFYLLSGAPERVAKSFELWKKLNPAYCG